jgi:3-deoxy-D-manno-octulosonic-acid transferase
MADFVLSLCIRLYSLVLSLGGVIARPFLEKRDRAGRYRIRERMRIPYAEKDVRGTTVVWFHAASLGEAKILCRFMDIYHGRHPEHLAVCTAVSTTGVAYLRAHKPAYAAAVGFFPLDTIGLITDMIDRFSISRVWLMETELWPSLLWVCKRRGTAVGIVNARMEERSFELYRLFKYVFSPLVGRIDPVIAQDGAYARRFAALGVRQQAISVTGNLKGFVPIHRPDPDQWREIRSRMHCDESDIVIVAGCVHADESEELARAIAETGAHEAGPKWIVAPRYIEEAAAIVGHLGADALHVDRVEVGRDWRVCVVGAYGVVEELYRMADAAVIGGTFDDTGGHNVWEAAQFGIPVFFGPRYHEQAQSCERLLTAGVAFRAGSGRELARRIMAVLHHEARDFIEAQKVFMEEMNKTVGSLEHLLP